MAKPLIDLPVNTRAPLQVHVNRNGFKESMHEIDVAVCDGDGKLILGMGDEEYLSAEVIENPLFLLNLVPLLC